MTTPAAVSAFWLSVLIAAIAVPLNTIFGIGSALVLVRGKARGRAILDALIDLPFVVSPVIVGLALILVYGQCGWFGTWFADHGIRIIFEPAGMVIATVFVSLPFVVREVAPVLREIGDEQEQAAATLGASGWQTFWRITLPSIRWGVAYGVVLTTARALGEIGAVLVVSSNVPGHTLTLPLLVYQRAADLGAAGDQRRLRRRHRARRDLPGRPARHDPALTPEGKTQNEDRRREHLQALRRLPRARGRVADRPRGLADGLLGPERLGEIDAAADHRRPRDARHRRGSRSPATT